MNNDPTLELTPMSAGLRVTGCRFANLAWTRRFHGTAPVPSRHLLRDFDVDQKTLTLTLNRPRYRNALSTTFLGDIKEALDEASSRSDVHVIVVQAEGTVFSSGHDLKEVMSADQTFETRLRLFKLCSDVMMSITQHRVPIIAKVDGMATAAGCQLVAACDLVVASSRSSFATPGVDIGLFCSTPAVSLSRAVSRRHAMDMLLTGDIIDAEEAKRIGLVNRVVDPGNLDATVSTLATKISKKSPHSIRIGKRAFYQQLNLNLEEAYQHASQTMAENVNAPDAVEGIGAFLEKRPPEWPSVRDA